MRTAAAGGGRRRYRSLTTLRRARPRCLLLLFLIAICVPVIFFNYTTISYLLRPIWDSPPKPFQVSFCLRLCLCLPVFLCLFVSSSHSADPIPLVDHMWRRSRNEASVKVFRMCTTSAARLLLLLILIYAA
jgi:hypothetical protein